jgi:hypothetical protein
MWSVLLFANNRGDPLARPEIIWGMVGLTVALLIGAAVIYAVDKWRKRATAPDDETNALTSFRAMYESGEITEAEYAELRRRVAEKVKKPVASVTASTPPGATTGATPGAAPAAQPGERATVNPPAPPSGTPESHPPPSSA